MSEFDNGQNPVESEAERVAEERREKVAGFRLNISPDDMDAPLDIVPKRKAPPMRPSVDTEEEPAIHTVPSTVNGVAAEKEAVPEERAPAPAAAVSAIAAAVAAKIGEEGDIGEWTKPEEPAPTEEEAVEEPIEEPVADEPADEQPSEAVSEPEEAPEEDPNAPVRILDEEDDYEDPNAPVRILDEEDEYEEPGSRKKSCMGKLFYLVCVLAVSCVLAFIAVTGALDMLGLNKSEREVDVEIPRGATTKQVADVLHENGLVSKPFIFRVFSKLSHADGQYQSGVFTVASNAGYQGIIAILQQQGERDSVDVTIPEGYNVLEIAKLLEESEVCGAQEFLTELEEGDYSDYDFIASAPAVGAGTDYPYRIYRLEGYLFPDTYTFYKACSPEAVLEKFFDNFETRVDTKLKTGIKAMGLSLDEAVTLASVIQMEADNTDDMSKIARVFHNRLGDPAEFPHLQSDVTTEYVEHFQPGAGKENENFKAYSTYICEGLPTGPICNPGLAALRAVAYPNDDDDIINCYYFATDTSVDPTITYYSETFDEHMAICYKYDIGVYAD